MKTFTLYRKKDLSGISGVGTVAEGVEFHDGQVVISWFGQFHSINIYPSMEIMLSVHGHGGATEVIYDPPFQKPQ